jgi:hypothetical protein
MGFAESLVFLNTHFLTGNQSTEDEAADVKRLKDPQEENFRLKRMFTELSIDHAILKDMMSKKAPPCKKKGTDIVGS